MAYVNPSTQTVKTCFQSHYSLPYFQREYKWESRHFTELLNDIQSTFLLDFDPTHGRQEVGNYLPYFLGSIITSKEANGKKPLIDGQQRLTSTFLLLAYLERYRIDNDVKSVADIGVLLGNVNYGTKDYSIEFSESRRQIFDLYLDETITTSEALVKAEDIQKLDDGDKKIIEALRSTDAVLDDKVQENIAYFIDYVRERVQLIDISVESESEAHRVFVTMNDRGLRLGPIDLLKGLILSKIRDTNDSHACHKAWVESIRKLKDIDAEEDSSFFKNFFRAKWANTIRGKNKGDVAGDFDIIGDEYHRWFEDNTNRIGLLNADDYTKFAKEFITKFIEIHVFIRKCEDSFTPEFECLFYNASRRFSSQPMIMLAAINPDDTTDVWQTKISLISKYIDLILTSRTIEGKTNNYDNLKDIAFTLTKEVRDKKLPELLTYIQGEWQKYQNSIDRLDQFTYTKSDRSDMLYILARIASHLEDELTLTNKVGFQTYWQRDRGMKTFDIEHLLKDAYDVTSLPGDHGFTDAKDYSEYRNRIGALALLPRSRNRSLQDNSYKNKLHAYHAENILTQSLCEDYYKHNPVLTKYLAAKPKITLSGIPDFSKDHITKRADAYKAVAFEIWEKP
ncbi:DUF262 domain-containing protein [Pseudomonas alloputida]|uniref:DUF262 domain-containing protein n=1 Tax=Pseudomonas alloputida TaxID=1940621 RepID=A0AAW7HQ89_9PSED|nr:DUF262 domain-containing protein [Pseudomonas alloputida]MCE0864698.1 DUF262 domain-containing HNH endonuclease family protein [Pseudomonas alloputida]MCE0870554.1 DUF262 domain-containing HNH endonuclease family protein [Pseudomonas alloputida]MCE0893669.1 DUF262 domain-containing HNH endonuclease family protein [Pseudomonas alloputida]MCE1049227.1 DUF262 domain-containing HNH endonuclease family protein [Pseudomonas alloputida]MCE1095374.1 DUF262 domain-containing HNH endonuclease family 